MKTYITRNLFDYIPGRAHFTKARPINNHSKLRGKLLAHAARLDWLKLSRGDDELYDDSDDDHCDVEEDDLQDEDEWSESDSESDMADSKAAVTRN